MKHAAIVARYVIIGVPLAQLRLACTLAARGHEVIGSSDLSQETSRCRRSFRQQGGLTRNDHIT